MKRKHIIAIICLFCLSFQYEITAQNKSKVDEIRDELLNPNNNSVLVVAHRGRLAVCTGEFIGCH